MHSRCEGALTAAGEALGEGGCCLMTVCSCVTLAGVCVALAAAAAACATAVAAILFCMAVALTICALDIDAIVDSARSRAP